MGTDVLDRARAARTALERLGASIPGFQGYLERELRREVDQLLRATLAERIDAARQRVMAHTRTLPLAEGARLGRIASLEKRLDQMANALRHAGSGYAGWFDAVKIGEAELETLYRYDLALLETIDRLLAAAGRVGENEGVLAEVEAACEEVAQAITGRDQAVKGVVPA
jgi:hypothetical protein